MSEQDALVFDEVRHGTEEYTQTLALRDAILRIPLGLTFPPEELAEEKDSFHLACRRGDEWIACLVLKPLSDRRVRMRQLAVAQAWQGKGIGRRLVEYAEAFARDRGYREIVLHVRETAVGFYERLGYRKQGERFIEVTIPHYPMGKMLDDGHGLTSVHDEGCPRGGLDS